MRSWLLGGFAFLSGLLWCTFGLLSVSFAGGVFRCFDCVGLFVIGLYFAFLWRWLVLVSFTILFSDLVVTLGFCCILGLAFFGWCLVFVDYVIWFFSFRWWFGSGWV